MKISTGAFYQERVTESEEAEALRRYRAGCLSSRDPQTREAGSCAAWFLEKAIPGTLDLFINTDPANRPYQRKDGTQSDLRIIWIGSVYAHGNPQFGIPNLIEKANEWAADLTTGRIKEKEKIFARLKKDEFLFDPKIQPLLEEKLPNVSRLLFVVRNSP